MAQVVKGAKGTYGFYNIGYRHADGQVFPALVVSSGSLGVPAAPTVTNVGAAGAAAYSYRVTALSGSGETTPGTAGTTATGNATLDGTNYNRVTWAAVTGATGYKVYGRTAAGELLMATILVTAAGGVNKVGGGTINGSSAGDGFEDKGTVTPAGALPGSNTAKTYTVRVPALRQGSSGGTNWVKTGMTIGTHRAQSNVLVQGR